MAVEVGEAVLLVGVAVGVDDVVGNTRAVCVSAAAAVCTIKVFTAPGASVGAGLTALGITHAVINTNVVSHRNPVFLIFTVLRNL